MSYDLTVWNYEDCSQINLSVLRKRYHVSHVSLSRNVGRSRGARECPLESPLGGTAGIAGMQVWIMNENTRISLLDKSEHSSMGSWWTEKTVLDERSLPTQISSEILMGSRSEHLHKIVQVQKLIKFLRFRDFGCWLVSLWTWSYVTTASQAKKKNKRFKN